MRTKRTPLRQSPKQGEGEFEKKRPENGVDRNKEAPRGRGSRQRVEATSEAPAPAAAAPRRRVPLPQTGRANRGSVGRNGKPIVEAKPERLQKVLAQAGVGSRREMEEWIAAGRITINGVVATLGQSVVPSDKVIVRPGRSCTTTSIEALGFGANGSKRKIDVSVEAYIFRSGPISSPNGKSIPVTSSRMRLPAGRDGSSSSKRPCAGVQLPCRQRRTPCGPESARSCAER